MEHTNVEILLVDDDPIILKILAEYLGAEGYRTGTAANGQEAWELLQKEPHRFSAMILDRMMPKMSGIDLLHKIRTMTVLHRMPIIMLTGHAEREDVGAAMIAGVYDFLYKPIDRDLLLLVLRRALRDRAV